MSKELKVLSLCLALLFAACSKEETKKSTSQRSAAGIRVEAVVIKPEELQSIVRGVGILKASKEVEIQSEIVGKVKNIYFKDGQNVKAFQSLVKIEDENLKAVMEKANSKLKLSRNNAQRKKQQFDAGAISASEWEIMESDLQLAQADSIDAQANLAKALIKAPFAGTLGISKITLGKRLAVGEPIVKIVQKFPLKVDFSVADKYASVLKSGMEVEFSRSNEKYEAVIEALESSLDGSTRTLQARAVINGTPDNLVPGAPIEFLLNLPSRESLTVPPEAITSDALGSIVYLFKGGKAHIARVELGTRYVDKVEIVSGISAGDTVLSVGASPVREGSDIEITRLK